MKKYSSTSLVSLLKEDPDYLIRVDEIKEEVKKDKAKIMKMADSYNQKYKNEISNGTTLKRKLIDEGVRSGKSEEEVERNLGFIPSIYTPILNWLYYFMQENNVPGRELLREEQEKKYGNLLHEKQNVENMEKVPEAFVMLSGKITNEQFQRLKKLKRLSRSPNENEAFQAYRKCMQLCEAFEVDFDKIPV